MQAPQLAAVVAADCPTDRLRIDPDERGNHWTSALDAASRSSDCASARSGQKSVHSGPPALPRDWTRAVGRESKISSPPPTLRRRFSAVNSIGVSIPQDFLEIILAGAGCGCLHPGRPRSDRPPQRRITSAFHGGGREGRPDPHINLWKRRWRGSSWTKEGRERSLSLQIATGLELLPAPCAALPREKEKGRPAGGPSLSTC